MYEERIEHPHAMDSNRMAVLKSATNQQGQLAQALRQLWEHVCGAKQMQGRPQMTTDIIQEVNMGASQKSLPMDPSFVYGQATLQSESGLGGAEMQRSQLSISYFTTMQLGAKL
ncbi:transcriptional corepressor LEUNIG_HOMOLOG-like [Rhododendron vialii]|uniref:transcriptional corepressor LEUNIG_HOMOLOG-like n=1 Tax=Rhododendron vialii TaxID=182163 RepID=UPI00265E6FB7|nr:transcriptional corepressor LEUNIG_HOMOLOG-like [Rhododendron vialii]